MLYDVSHVFEYIATQESIHIFFIFDIFQLQFSNIFTHSIKCQRHKATIIIRKVVCSELGIIVGKATGKGLSGNGVNSGNARVLII